MPNTIVLKQGQAQRVQIEKVANAALYAGNLVELMSTDKVKKHATAGGDVAPIMFALEDSLRGRGITDAYSAADIVTVWLPQRGDEVYALLADGQNVAIGDKLESDGNGCLTKYTADVDPAHSSDIGDAAMTNYGNQIAAIAVEALDLSASSGVDGAGDYDYDKRLKVMVI